MAESIGSKVAVGVITAVILGGLTLLYNWGSNGGLVRALGGVTEEEVDAKIAEVKLQSSVELAASASSVEKLRANVARLQSSLQSLDQGLGDLREDVRPAVELAPQIDEQLDGLTIPAPIPSGSVIASLNRCSDLGEDWQDFDAGAGRMIVGVGTAEIAGFSRTFRLEETDGYYEHELTIEQMPAHAHLTSTSYESFDLAPYGHGERTPKQEDFNSGKRAVGGTFQDKPYPSALTFTAGEGQPHNNMPPYIALYFCKKEAS